MRSRVAGLVQGSGRSFSETETLQHELAAAGVVSCDICCALQDAWHALILEFMNRNPKSFKPGAVPP